MNINPSILLTAFLVKGCWSAEANSIGHWVTPWTAPQSIKGSAYRKKQAFTLTFTPMANVESQINLTTCLWMVGRSQSRNQRKKSMQTCGEHANFTQKCTWPAGGIEFSICWSSTVGWTEDRNFSDHLPTWTNVFVFVMLVNLPLNYRFDLIVFNSTSYNLLSSLFSLSLSTQTYSY